MAGVTHTTRSAWRITRDSIHRSRASARGLGVAFCSLDAQGSRKSATHGMPHTAFATPATRCAVNGGAVETTQSTRWVHAARTDAKVAKGSQPRYSSGV